jgi:hypothetical protein
MRDLVRKLILIGALAIFIALLIVPEKAFAIPAFARKYRMSCTTCHAPVPRLKDFGADFAGNAFQLEESQEPPRFLYDTGDEHLTLMRDLPIAVRFDAYASYDRDDESDAADFKVPYGMKLLSGGNISKHIGYYFYFYMTEAGEVTGIEDAYLHFDNLFGKELDLIVGQFQASDPLFKRELRITYEDYQIYGTRVGDTPTNLTYDRGFMLLYSTSFGLDAVALFVNGNGKGEMNNGYFDEDDWKNGMLRLSQSVGPVRVGGFGYLGNSIKAVGTNSVENEHYYWGIDGTIDLEDKLQINVQYLERHDDDPYFLRVDPYDVDMKGGFVEAIWSVGGEMGRTFVTFLYNYIDSDLDNLDYSAGTLSLSYLLRRNVRLVAEGTYHEDTEATRLVAGVVSAF